MHPKKQSIMFLQAQGVVVVVNPENVQMVPFSSVNQGPGCSTHQPNSTNHISEHSTQNHSATVVYPAV